MDSGSNLLYDAFRRVADRWDLTVDQRCALLDVGRTTHYDWMTGRLPKVLTRYQREAILHVVAIDLAAVTYVGLSDGPSTAGGADARPLADRYVTLPGSAPDGVSVALDVMLSGIAGLAQVRAALEMRNGASPVATLTALGALLDAELGQNTVAR